MTEYVMYPRASVDMPDNRGNFGTAVAPAVVLSLFVGTNSKLQLIRFTADEARMLAESLLTASRYLEGGS